MMSDEKMPSLAPPPRSLPLTLAVRALLGGWLNQIGWGLLALGVLQIWLFDADDEFANLVRFSGEVTAVQGVSTGWREVNLQINDTQVYETTFDFSSADGRRFSGSSFATGTFVASGQPVMVEYPVDDPSVARIDGMRSTLIGRAALSVYLFTVTGLALAFMGLRNGIRARRLMTEGELAHATLESSADTHWKTNERPVLKLTFAFEAKGGGTYRVTTKTHRTEDFDEPGERVVYNPRHPEDAILLDALPSSPAINSRGEFTPRPGQGVSSALTLLAPTASVLGVLALMVL